MDKVRGFPGDPEVTPGLAHEHKLTSGEYDKLRAALGRDPTYPELGVVSVMWSEHCSYKSSRVHLKRLKTDGPRVIQGPGENAGVVDIGDGFAAVFKIESHNHPSYIEPFQGAATGVGGIVRDVFTMGARPIAALNSLRFGRPDHPKTSHLLREVVAGIAAYGNCLGVPMVGGDTFFDPAYDGNILVNAFACGVARSDAIFYGRASGVGNSVMYVGAKTGRDGIHGATMASDEFSEEGPSQRPTVQVGDPFMEKLLIEACLEIFAADVLVGVQDMGAAGLTSSSVEMASRSGSGLELDLDRIPRRARGMTPYEMLLSESQERMLMVAKPGLEDQVRAICEKWGLDVAVVGKVTDSGRWVVKATPGHDPLDPNSAPVNPQEVCSLPVDLLTDDAPIYQRPIGRVAEELPPAEADAFAPIEDFSAELLAFCGDANLGSRHWIWRQYDTIVRGGTRLRPGADAAVVRVPCEKDGKTVDKWLAFAVDGKGVACEVDPNDGGAKTAAEVCRNLACVGATPIGLSDCLNFGSPERKHVMWQFSESIDGINRACHALDVPIVSGNVSFYNETDGRAVLPTPTLAGVGIVEDPDSVTEPWFKQEGDVILLVGQAEATLGASQWLRRKTGRISGRGIAIDLAFEARLQQLLRDLANARPKPLASVHDISDGGLAVALAECCGKEAIEQISFGATIELPDGDLTTSLFGEAASRVLVSCPIANVAAVVARAKTLGIPVATIGTVGGDSLTLRQAGKEIATVNIAALRAAREACLDDALA